MTNLPEPKPAATAAGQAEKNAAIHEQADQLMAALSEIAAQQPTSFRSENPDVPSWRDGPRIGTAPPVAQPGQTPMSERATDAGALMLAAGATTFMVGGATSFVMLASQYADPVVCAIVVGAPTVLVLALARLLGKAKAVVEAAPAPVHHHYNGSVTVDQRSINSQTRGVIANTRNQTPS